MILYNRNIPKKSKVFLYQTYTGLTKTIFFIGTTTKFQYDVITAFVITKIDDIDFRCWKSAATHCNQ